MSTRMRGFLILSASLLATAGVVWFAFRLAPGTRVPAYPLALPLVGVMVGLLEWTTGVPIKHLDEAWQKWPAYVKGPVALTGSVLFLYGFVKILGF
jgi:hypothetical protein